MSNLYRMFGTSYDYLVVKVEVYISLFPCNTVNMFIQFVTSEYENLVLVIKFIVCCCIFGGFPVLADDSIHHRTRALVLTKILSK